MYTYKYIHVCNYTIMAIEKLCIVCIDIWSIL